MLRDIRSRWRERSLFGGGTRPRQELRAAELDRLRHALRDCLTARGGEVSAWERAAELATTYLSLGDVGRTAFLSLIASEFGTPLEPAVEAARRIIDSADPADRAESVRAARVALEPPWVRLLTQFNNLVGGAKFLVDLRADLLRFAQEDQALAPLKHDLKQLLTSWFGVGQLELRRITWDSPASLLERLAQAEAVHEVASWDDLKNRLDVDRRFFAFLHPRMPDEPLIFLEVALVPGLVDAIGPLLDPNAPLIVPAEAGVAIFYSISSTQPGLSAISLGGFLIKQVVDELKSELPRLRTFATLSPIPGFRPWLEPVVDDKRLKLHEADRRRIAALLRREQPEHGDSLEGLRNVLLQLCAHYLLNARRPDGQALDAVANFHLTNGARVERLNWLADRSEHGWVGSLGLMANYLYELDAIEANHEAYAADGTIAATASVTRLARGVAA